MSRARDGEGRRGGALAATIVLALALGGCNAAIDTYRNLRGLSRNDPDPATAPNTKNLAIAEAEPYPHLASVPPPPTGIATAAEREQLLRSLTRGRTGIEASDRRLRAGESVAFAVPPPPPPLPFGTRANPPAPPGAKPMVLRKPGTPPVPGPRESPLVSPRIAAVPQPEAARPAPPAPHLAAIPVPAPAALPTAAAAAAGFRPAPPPPLLAPPPSPHLAAAVATKPPVAAAGRELAEIRFPADATRLEAGDRATLARVAALARPRPGTLRIVGFAGSGGGARRPLAGFRAALDRAQAVAAALEQAGIPAARIKIEAAPASADAGEARAEISLEP
jgi:outer membrane protein OmpA-like peptidoglycan-associated protein